MRAVPLPDPDPVVAAAIGKKYAGRRAPLAVTMRDRLGEWMTDDLFAAAFGARGRPGLPPARLAMVTVLQMTENLTDRQAAEAVAARLDWQYALGLPLDEPGFDHSVLSEFRTRVCAHGLEEAALDALLARLSAEGLVKAGGKQRTDSTHVIAAVRALHAIELTGESVRAALEALAAACPGWLAARLCAGDWARRYGARADSWRLPAGKAARDQLTIEFARDGYALVRACCEDSAPPWARDLPAVQVLRTVLLQGFHLDAGEDGREVIRRREPGLESGVPPASIKVSSPYDPDARWGAKDPDLLWLGYKLHVTETCDDPPACGCPPDPAAARPRRCAHDTLPNLITHVATTDATVGDAVMTIPVTAALAGKGLAPARHYLDSGYASPGHMITAARDHGVTLVTPLLGNYSRQAREAKGYSRQDFAIDFEARTATCPQGLTAGKWTPASDRGRPAVHIAFRQSDCKPCPARPDCTTSTRRGRQLMIPARDLYLTQAAARASQGQPEWHDDYKRRAGIEATMSQAVTVTGSRHARYRGLPKTRLQHAYTAVALNLHRLDAYWNDIPHDRTRTSHLTRLGLTATADELTTNIPKPGSVVLYGEQLPAVTGAGREATCPGAGLRSGLVTWRERPRPFCEDLDRPRFLITANGRGRSIVLHEVTAGETVLLVMLFPHLAGLDVLRVEDLGADGVRITARTRTASAACRLCGQASSAGHDRYPRWLGDLPCGGRPVEVLVPARRFRCANPGCPAATFAEQVPGLTAFYQRRTPGLRGLLETAALALAGRAGARLAAALGAAVSRDVLIGLVRALPDPDPGPVAVLGADDVAVRKGQHYATVLVNMETHQVIDLLPGRDGDVLADWLTARPGTAVICRDRAGGYGDGAARGAPGALQVADRWHLWHNLCEYTGKTAARHRGCLAAPAEDPAAAAAARQAAAEAQAAAVRERYEQVRELSAAGHGPAAIARSTGLAREAVRRYLSAGSPDELLSLITSGLPSPLDPYKPYLARRWAEGCRNATTLLAEARDLGYRGSYRVLSAYLHPFRKAGTLPPEDPAPKSRDIARWILTSPENLNDDAPALARARAQCPHLDALARHVAGFAKMLTGLHGDRLDDWLAAVEADDQPDLHSFARGIRRDYQAVRNGLTLHWSSGAVEGNNCKIKHIKRLMYGRANFDLLRKMAILN